MSKLKQILNPDNLVKMSYKECSEKADMYAAKVKNEREKGGSYLTLASLALFPLVMSEPIMASMLAVTGFGYAIKNYVKASRDSSAAAVLRKCALGMSYKECQEKEAAFQKATAGMGGRMLLPFAAILNGMPLMGDALGPRVKVGICLGCLTALLWGSMKFLPHLFAETKAFKLAKAVALKRQEGAPQIPSSQLNPQNVKQAPGVC